MRILACNPDTIGDLILRQPLYRALSAAGHELCLVVRASVESAVPLVAPGARVVVLPREVYGGVDEHWADFAPAVAAARDFAPGLLLVAPYQWTRFEERLAEALRAGLPQIKVAGMTGRLFAGDPHAGHGPASTLAFDQSAAVDEDLHEAEKNAALAAVLGARVASVDPVITPDDTSLDTARQILAERGLVPGKFAVACVAGTVHVPIKAWPEERWAAALAEWHRLHGRRFLFVGLADERPAVDRVRELMGDAAAGTAVWMEPEGSIDVLAALASLSAGYVGHDTGPMHVVAAVGKPVLGIFGGGHKLRFAPRVSPSVTLSVRVPCAGCGWVCSFETSHCVKELTVEQVLAAASDLEAGRVTTCEVRLQNLPVGVHERMTRFAADLARERLRDLGDARAALAASSPEARQRLAAERDDYALQVDALTREAAKVASLARETEQAMAALADESAGLVRQLAEREQTVAALRSAVDEANARTVAEAEGRRQDAELLRAEAAAVRQQWEAARAEAEKARHDAEEAKKDLEILRAQHAPPPAKDARPPRVRKSLRERVVDLVCGQRHYTPRSVPPPMPKICVVTRVWLEDKDDDVRRTVESVLAERYPHLEYVLAGDAGRAVVAEFAGRVTKVVPLGDQPFAGVAEALARTDADVVCWLDTHFSLEPGALMRAGEYFRDHSLAMAVAFEQTVDSRGQGWRRPASIDRLDVMSLRRSRLDTVVLFRSQACALLGPLDPAKGAAAGWDLGIRFSRRFGIRRGRGHFECVRSWPELSTPASGPSADEVEYAAARKAFDQSFGVLGRLRCVLLDRLASTRDRAGAVARQLGFVGRVARKSRPLPSISPPSGSIPASAASGSTPVSPVTHRRPDRLLLTSRDVATGDATLFRAYYDDAGDCSLSFPLATSEHLERLHAERQALSKSPPQLYARPFERILDEVRANVAGQLGESVDDVDLGSSFSPYAGYRGGPIWTRALAALPSPYWKLSGRRAGDEPAAGRVASLVGPAVAGDPSVRALVVGCYDGAVLDDLKRLTKWQLTGLETNEQALQQTRGRGHEVWPVSPQDAFMSLPDGRVFDLVFVPDMLEHWDDPPWVLRRLLRLLSPAGRLVVRTPNLDTALLDLFGPTWWHWQLPHHRVLFGRRGLKLLAAACDLRVERLKTVTDAYAAAASVQLNRVGLAGVVPEGAAFPADVSARGAKLAGWARTFWDRWGRGDEMWAVLRPL